MHARLRRYGAFTPLLAMLAVVGATATAGAVDPAPTPCGAVSITDPAKDSTYNVTPVGGAVATQAAAGANTDIRQVFFNTTMVDGKPKYTANIVVTKLDKTPAPLQNMDGALWEVDFYTSTDQFRLRAYMTNAGAFTYKVQHFPNPTGQAGAPRRGEEAETTGRIFEGVDGIIQIDFPAIVTGMAPDKPLKDVKSLSGYSHPGNQIRSVTDFAPDTGVKPGPIGICSGEPAVTPTPEATPTASPEPTPAPQQPQSTPAPQQQQSGPAPAASPTPTPAAPAKKPAAKKKKAKKCKKARGKAKGHTKKGFAKCPKPKKKKAARR